MDVSEEVVEDLQTTLLSGVTEETDLDDTGDPGVTEEADLGGTSDPGVTEEADLGSPNDLNQSSEHRGFPDEQLQRDTTYTICDMPYTLALWNKMPRYFHSLVYSYFFTLCFWCLVSPLFKCKSCEVKETIPPGLPPGIPYEPLRQIECKHDDYLKFLFVWLPVSVCTIYFSFPGYVFPFLGRYEDKWYWHRFLLGMLTWTLLLIIYFGTTNLCELHLFGRYGGRCRFMGHGRPTPRHCPSYHDCDDKYDNFNSAWFIITQVGWFASCLLIATRLSRNALLPTHWCLSGIYKMLVVIWCLYHVAITLLYLLTGLC